jgi:O2-independent ubiquinone biosynthesis accessory factor UbiT
VVYRRYLAPVMPAGSVSIASFVNAPRVLFAPLPLPVLQPALKRVAATVFQARPELAARLGPHKTKRFLVDPVNLPFAFLLRPDPSHAVLEAVRRRPDVPHDARIAGTFLALLDMVDGRLDGDALFFSRELQVTGDTEAVVSLRNALDDVEGGLADDVAALYGPPGRHLLKALRTISDRVRNGE